MSETKDKIMQVLNDNYMVNLFSANAREHIANKIVDNLNGDYANKTVPANTVAIKPEDVKKEVTEVSTKDKTSSEKVSKPASKRVNTKRPPKPPVKRSGLKNLSKS